MATVLNLYEKLIEIRKEVKNFSKDTASHGYSYVSGSQAIHKIRETMDKLGVLLIPSVGLLENRTYDYKTTKGAEKTDFIVSGVMTYTWVDANDPNDKLEIPWFLYGSQDDISKAFGSGLTYSERYFILKFFQAPTDELDPDSRNTQDRAASYKPQQQVSSQQGSANCTMCGCNVNAPVANYSLSKFKKILCMDCQKKQ